jgi:hypothetical protein
MAERNSPFIIAVRYPRFYEAVRESLQEALGFLRGKIGEPPQWPKRRAQRVIFDSSTQSHLEAFEEDSPGDLITSIQSTLETRPSYLNAVKQLEGLKDQGKAVPMLFPLGPSFLLPILADYLENQRNLDFDENNLRKAYNYVEDYIGADRAVFRLYLLIWGSNGSEPEVKLSDTHRIYRVDEAEATRLWTIMAPPTLSGFSWGSFRSWPLPGNHIVEAMFRFPKQDLGNLALHLAAEETQTIRALRLSGLSAGSIQYLAYESAGFVPTFGKLGLPGMLKPLGGPYELNEAGLPSIRQYWPSAYELSSTLQRSPEKAPVHLRIPAARFSSSFEKPLSEDQLIDYFIAFEALFTRENDAVSYRLPLRAAIFTGDSPRDRDEIFSTVRAGYDLRSNLAHGQNQLTDSVKVRDRRVPIREFMNDLRRILFNSVHRFVRCNSAVTKDVVIRAIDDAAISQDRAALQRLWS